MKIAIAGKGIGSFMISIRDTKRITIDVFPSTLKPLGVGKRVKVKPIKIA